MKTKMSCISCILALMITATVWAEEGIFNDPKVPESPQNTATAGLTTAEADQFMSTTEWGEVKFNKAFIYAGFERENINTLDVGAAFKAGPVYIGSWYQGNFGDYSRTKNNSVTTTIKQSTPGLLGNKKTTFAPGLFQNYTANHTAVVLVGFGSMGIKLGYKRTGDNKSGKYFGGPNAMPDDIIKHSIAGGIKETVYSPKGYINAAKHLPFVEFGMNVGLGRMTLSPTVGLEVYVNQDSSYGFKTVTKKASDVNYSIEKEAKAKNDSYIGIIGKLGMGLALGDSLNSALTFGYELTANVYGKTYKDASGKTHKVRGSYENVTDTSNDVYGDNGSARTRKRTDTFQADFTTKSLYKNKLNVEYAMQKDFTDRFSLFAGVACPITVTADKQVKTMVYEQTEVTTYLDSADAYNNTTVRTVTSHPETTTNTVMLNIDPVIKAAVSYAAVPNRLFLNLGTEVTVLKGSYTNTKTTVNSFVSKTVKTTTRADGSVVVKETSANKTSDPTESVSHVSTLKQVEAELKGGLRWNIVDNFALDLTYTQLLKQKIGFGKLKLACTVKF